MDALYNGFRCTKVIKTGIYKGFIFYICKVGMHPTAYIEVSSHDTLYGYVSSLEHQIKVHGGITYSGKNLYCATPKEACRYLGWDYAHFGDCHYDVNIGKKWTLEEITNECISVIEQLLVLKNKNENGGK